MRLDRHKRERLATRATALVFDPREKALKEQGLVLARLLRDKLIPAIQRDHMDSLPLDWFPRMNNYGSSTYNFQVSIEGESSRFHALPVPDDMRLPRCFYNNAQLLPEKGNKTLIGKIEAYSEAHKALATERKAFYAQTLGTLNACFTRDAVIKLMPDMASLLPEVPVVKAHLPVEKANVINAQIKTALAAQEVAA